MLNSNEIPRDLIIRQDGIDPYPEVLLRGQIFLSIMQSLTYFNYQPLADEWLEESGIDQIDPDSWYPRQEWLNLLKKLEKGINSSENQVAIGVKVIENAKIPEDMIADSVEAAIGMLIAVYTSEQKNLPLGDQGYYITKKDDNHYEILDGNPYLFNVTYGYIWGILRRFLKRPFVLTHEFINKEQPEMGGVIFTVTLD